MSGGTTGVRVTLTIDGRRLTVPIGRTLLAVARDAGIEIPTLCDHPALEPIGACRLCVVEVTHPDWNGWRNLVTSCLYPVADGLEVSTANDAVREARRRVLALLAARCPGSPVVAQLAQRYGADTSRLALTEDGDNCILCGLCVRVCETYATSAIVTHSRGNTKAIGAFGGRAPADCVGCGGCAAVCPTGNIAAARTATGYEIWGRSFDTAVAIVDAARCVGCGVCEEACPFHVARVVLAPGGGRTAQIPAEQCRGCGACLGACPSGAIAQPAYSWHNLRGRQHGGGAVAVFACQRSGLRTSDLPADCTLIEVPCTGRVTLPLLLGSLVAGRERVLVLGRHSATCRLDGAEDPARVRAAQAAELAAVVGYGAGRVRFVEPSPGPDGPLAAVRGFVAQRSPIDAPSSPPARGAGADLPAVQHALAHEGLDAALALASALSPNAEGFAGLAAWLAAHGLPAAVPGRPALTLGTLPLLDVACGDLVRPVRLAEITQAALVVLGRLGLPGAGIWLGEGASGFKGRRSSDAGRAGDAAVSVVALAPVDAPELTRAGLAVTALDDLLREAAASWPRPPAPVAVGCSGSPAEIALIEALGYRAVDVGPDPLPDSFAMTPEDRRRAEARLAAADRAGAAALYCPDPTSLARWAIVTRQGTWRSTRARPALGVQLAWLALAGIPLTPEALAAGLAAAIGTVEVRG